MVPEVKGTPAEVPQDASSQAVPPLGVSSRLWPGAMWEVEAALDRVTGELGVRSL